MRRFMSLPQRLYKDPQNVQALVLWGAAFVTGIVAVEYAALVKFFETTFLDVVATNPYIVFALSPVCLVAGWYMVYKFSPEAGGSGIPQIMAANELDYTKHKSAVDRFLSLKVAVVKVASSLFAVAGGAAIGREGPTLQISACLFHFFGARVRRRFPMVSVQTWIIAGSGAGLAAAFNTPLGGIVYAIEEMGSKHFNRVKTSLFTSVIIAGLVSQWLLGPYLYLGFPKLVPISFSFLPYAVAVGVLSGGLGALFGVALVKAVKIRARATSFRSQLLLAAGAGIVVASLIWSNSAASGGGMETMNRLLFDDEMASPWLVAVRFLGTFFAYLSGAAGGIFAPSLSAGAAFGSYLEQFLHSGHMHLMILLGMIGFLTGVTRTPFTSFILVLEMTDRHSAIFPMMLCALIANGVAILVSHEGFYEVVKSRYLEKIEGPKPVESATATAAT